MADKNRFRIFIDDKVNLRGLKSLQARLGRVRESIRNAFNSKPLTLFKLGVFGAAAALVAATKEAVSFNIAMARAWTMSSKGKGWFRDMREEVRSLSAELGVATDQLAGGLYQALSAGVPENNVIEFLRTAAKVAVADGSQVGTAVDGVTTILNAFKIEAADTDRVVDLMFNTVANGKTTFSELAGYLSTVAPLAAANGIALEQVLAAVATLTKQGTPTAQAMTQIRAAIIGANKALGDGWTKTLSLQEGLAKIEEEADGSQNKLMELVGSIEAVQGVLGLAGINAQMAAQDLDETTNAAGRLDQAFKKVQEFRQWQQLWKSVAGLVERTAQEADSRLAPAVREMVEAIAEIQDNDDLWNGLGATLDDAQAKAQALFAFIQSEGADGAKDILDAMGHILLGHAQDGAEEAVKVLAKWIPLLGSELGKAVWDGIRGGGDAKSRAKSKTNYQARRDADAQATAELGFGYDPATGWAFSENNRKWNKRRNEIEDQLKKQYFPGNLKAELAADGLQVAGNVGTGAGTANKAQGYAKLDDIINRGEGQMIIKQIEADVQREIDDMERERQAKEQRRAAERPEEARRLYMEQRKELGAAEKAASTYGQPSAEAMANLKRERQEMAQVSALIKEAMGGNGYTDALLAALREMLSEQKRVGTEVASLRDEVRNRR